MNMLERLANRPGFDCLVVFPVRYDTVAYSQEGRNCLVAGFGVAARIVTRSD